MKSLRCVAFLALVSNGCDRAPNATSGGSWVSERQQRGDTLIVRTLSGSVWGDTMVLVPELAIGELDGSPAFVFGRVSGLDVDADGRLVVADVQAQEVRIFSAAGEHVRTFGGSGDGPGEFRSPDHLQVISDGRIVVRDQGAARFSVFARDGDYVGSWPRGSGFSTNAPFFIDTDERVINPTLSDRLVVYELDGSVRDTIPAPSLGYAAPQLTVVIESGMASYSIPFMPGEEWTMTRDGRVLIGVASAYSFERRDPDEQILRIEREVEAVAVSAGEAAQEREHVTRTIRRANNPAWRWQGPDVPSTKPMFQALRAGVDGTVWVFRQGRSIEEPNPDWNPEHSDVGFPTRWRSPIIADVFDDEAGYLGPVQIPESIRWFDPPAILSRDRVWAATVHEAGYPQVVRFRVAKRQGAGS